MRSFYVENLLEEVELTDEQNHHLVNVIRKKSGEEVILHNGHGCFGDYKIKDIRKSRTILEKLNTKKQDPKHQVDFLVFIPKKKYLDNMIAQLCQLSVQKIYFIWGDYSQKYKINFERINLLIKKSCSQANNFHLPIFEQIESLRDIKIDYKLKLVFDNESDSNGDNLNIEDTKNLVLIGPEGGFSSEERTAFSEIGCQSVCLPTGILKAEIMPSVAMGYLIGKGLKA